MRPPARAARLRVSVVADDLSGAADTAVQFLRPGEEIPLVSLALSGGAAAPAPKAAGLAIDTATRGSPPALAVARVETAAAMVRRFGPDLVYHKVDSQLRGRPGLEIETLRRALGLRCTLVAPAHPGQDRVTIGGVHLVRGLPVADSEAGRDPAAPVTESHLPVLLATQSAVQVAHVLLTELEGDPGALHRRLDGLMADGHRIITFDATTSRQLERIAEASSRFPDVLLAGSAGLAAALASARHTGADPGSAEVPPCRSMLLVCGSMARSLRRQVAALVETGRCRRATLTAPGVAGERHPEALTRVATGWWDECDLVLQTPEERLHAGTATASRLLAGLADLALTLAGRRRPDAVLLSGGETAIAVLGAARVTAVRLRGEVIPGVPWGVAVGGALDGVTVVTKSGAFGRDEDLVEVHRRCRKDATHG